MMSVSVIKFIGCPEFWQWDVFVPMISLIAIFIVEAYELFLILWLGKGWQSINTCSETLRKKRCVIVCPIHCKKSDLT